MDSPAQIVDATAPQLKDMAEVLADAFASDPVLNWVMPATRIYPDFFANIIADTFLPRGICHLESAHRGAALWLPPGQKFEVRPSLALAKLMLQLLCDSGLAPLRRISQQAAVFERHLPREPHYHLLFLGARQANQGQGVGSALIKQGLSTVDAAGMPAYLESSNQRNVPLYERHGFEVIATQVLPGGGPQVWFMWRPGRS